MYLSFLSYNLLMKDSKKVLIVANGEANSRKFLKSLAAESDFVIGVDGGAGVLFSYGIKTNVAIGDFDSIDKKVLEKVKKSVKVLQYPREKDYSDTELAVHYAINRGFEDFTLTGMGGKRTDHLLFNLSVLYSLLKRGKNARICEENEDIYITNGMLSVKVNKGDTVSIYPFTIRAKVEKTVGLKYPLYNKVITKSKTLTLSNVALLDRISVKVLKGTVLLIVEKRVPSS